MQHFKGLGGGLIVLSLPSKQPYVVQFWGELCEEICGFPWHGDGEKI